MATTTGTEGAGSGSTGAGAGLAAGASTGSVAGAGGGAGAAHGVFPFAGMQSSFIIDPFDRHKMKWSRWVERLEGAFNLFDVQPDTRLFLLLHFMGGETYDILCDKLAPEKPQQRTYADIVAALEDHFNPEPLEILENFRFKCRRQGDDRPDESIDEYLIALRKLAITCKFGDYLNTALRNQFVFGLKDRAIQARLLEVRNLTLTRARDMAVSMELSSKGGREIQSKQDRPDVNLVDRQRSYKVQVKGAKRNKTNKDTGAGKTGESKGECYRCGSPTHFANKCPHIHTVCNFCKVVGHLQRVCLKAKKTVRSAKSSAHLLEEDSTADSNKNEVVTLEELCKLDAVAEPLGSKFWLDVKVDGKEVRFEVDTGAPVSIINVDDHRRFFGGKKLRPPNMELVSFCNTNIGIEGMLDVAVEYGAERVSLPLYVTSMRKHPLLGRQWMRRLRIDLNDVAYSVVHAFAAAAVPVPGRVTTKLPKVPATIAAATTVPERVPVELPKVSTADVKALVQRYANLYDDSIGKIRDLSAKLRLQPDAVPVYIKARPVPFSLRGAVEQELEKLVKDGVLEKVNHSAWATPVVPVMKANNRVRLCGDYKITVNPNLVVDEHPLPTMEELFANVAGGDKFSKIDLTQAYLQLEVEEEDREVLTLSTHKGLYRPTRLMYGVASAPAIWQRLMEEILSGIPGVTVFLDDIRVTGPNDQEHLRRLTEVLKRLSTYNMRINIDKCQFFTDEIEYCGYRIDKTGIHKVRSKVEAVQNMPTPANKDQVRSFVGLINYYGRFFPNLSTTLYPLNNLLKNAVPFVWSKQCQAAFDSVKQEMQSDRFLVHYNPSLPLVLATDASPYGVGAVLSHVYADGSERPISYASQTLNATQQAYKQVDWEAYAIIFGVRRFYQYLYGRRFILVTDNEPLKQILSDTKGLPKMSALRMQHYAIFLQSFDYSIQFRPTKQHGNADAFSRLPLKEKVPDNVIEETDMLEVNMIETLPITVEELAKATAADHTVKALLEGLRTERSIEPGHRFGVDQSEFTVQKGCILRGIRVYVPSSLRNRVLSELHSTHFGMTRLKSLARGYVWWQGIDGQIEEMVRNCSCCQSTRAEPAKAPTHCWQQPVRPFERIHVDFAGPFMQSYFIVLVDAYTKWPVVKILNNITTATTIQVCREYFATYGIPSVLVSDHGVQFTSEAFQDFLWKNGIYHKMGAPYHPSTNGLAERFIGTFKAKLKSLKCDKAMLQAELCNVLITYRNTIHPATGQSPAMMVYNRPLRSRLDLMIPNPETARKDVTEKVRSIPKGARVAARDYIDSDKWKYGVIAEKLGKLHYHVQLDDGRTWKRHIDQLREVGSRLESTRVPLPCELPNIPAVVSPQAKDTGPNISAGNNVSNEPVAEPDFQPPSSLTDKTSAGVDNTNQPVAVVPGSTASVPPVQRDYRQSPRRSGRATRPPTRLDL
ncbi:uncharacterized protein K02A2.6-like [Aedes albopictus]|uniref:RNA-directed DNA polymerase n=1 Tax=Aedes albopictus TaxID=7160 RepID=A0ABM1XW83_AEDAL